MTALSDRVEPYAPALPSSAPPLHRWPTDDLRHLLAVELVQGRASGRIAEAARLALYLRGER